MTEPDIKENPQAGDIWAGWLLAYLYKSWPAGINLDPRMVIEQTGVTIKDGNAGTAADDLFSWLVAEGYIRYRTRFMDGMVSGAELTEAALVRLKSVPSSLDTKKTLGEKMQDASAEITKGAAKASLADLFGQFIGGISKSMMQP
jgi:hypothetical protein